MILYHVSDRIDRELLKKLYPMVPYSAAAEGEDRTIPRICFSTSLSGCIEAIGLNTDEQEYITVYTLDTSTIDESKYLVTPSELSRRKLVLDAAEHDEYWVLCEVKLKPKYYKIINAEWGKPSNMSGRALIKLEVSEVSCREINDPLGRALSAMMGDNK